MYTHNQKIITAIPEWAPQDGILLTWPHENSDWDYMLPDIELTYKSLTEAIAKYERVVILVDNNKLNKEYFAPSARNNISIHQIPSNDTWIRDYGPLARIEQTRDSGVIQKQLLHFTFNGWGLKFAADKDNQCTRRLFKNGIFNKSVEYINAQKWALEGGGVECNGTDTLLYNKYWLNAPNRNDGLASDDLEDALKNYFGVSHLIHVDCEPLLGDDTDGHIDTIVRFVSDNALAYVSPSDSKSPNLFALKKLEEQVKKLRNSKGEPFELFALPDVGVYEIDGEQLPATYANFLIINNAVVMPIYGKDEIDQQAVDIIKKAFPDRAIVPVNASHLTRQHGSIHCASMQIPEGFL